MKAGPRVAIVHDWLTGLRGGERCLLSFLKLFPEADIFTLLHVPGATRPEIDARVRGTSWINRLPKVSRYYRVLLPFYPSAVRSLDLTEYPLVISLSHAAAKNVRVTDGTVHLCYCFTPMRYVWDQAQSYFGGMTPLLWPIISSLRSWDRAGSDGVDEFVGISRFVSARIRCFYGRDSRVIFPPVDTSWIRPGALQQRGEAFLYAGALVPYKRADLAVSACTRLNLPLWVVGGGPEERRLRQLAGPSVKFFGPVSDAHLADFYSRCRALIFPGTEDFGMVPIECLAAGRPVIARDEGALRESMIGVRPWRADSKESSPAPSRSTGVFIRGTGDELDQVCEALNYFAAHEDLFDSEFCRQRAREFSPVQFERSWQQLLSEFGFAEFRDAEAEAAAI